MSDLTMSILGIAAFVVVIVYLAGAKMRTNRRRQSRLSGAFERAQTVRTRGSGLQGSPYSIYAEPVWNVKPDSTGG